ncbi:MAG: ATP-dependent DNA helicase RecG, partial [Microcoleaceae cyanobacterium]
MSEAEIDWNRIQKALDIELSRGCINIQGNQYLFHEFLVVSLQNPPATLSPDHLAKWRAIAQKFSMYPQMDIVSRQNLIKTTQDVLLLAQDYLEKPGYTTTSEPSNKVTENIIIPGVNSANKTKQKTVDQEQNYSLDQKLTYVKGIGPKSANILAKLELSTVRDLLNYFPRDHLDYAQQVNICDLEPGETVTIIGKIKSCHCFTSQKNSKLTILEIVVTDRTGRLKISRFFAGSRFAGKPWQMQQHNIYK